MTTPWSCSEIIPRSRCQRAGDHHHRRRRAEYDTEVHTISPPSRFNWERCSPSARCSRPCSPIGQQHRYSLALWDAGSTSVFVAEMNALAMSLVQPLPTTSTSAGTIRARFDGGRLPAHRCGRHERSGLRQVVGLSSITLPLMGTRPTSFRRSVRQRGRRQVRLHLEGQGIMVWPPTTVGGRQVQVLVAVLGSRCPHRSLPLRHHHSASSHYRAASPTTAPPAPGAVPAHPPRPPSADHQPPPHPPHQPPPFAGRSRGAGSFRYTDRSSPRCSMPLRRPSCRSPRRRPVNRSAR